MGSRPNNALPIEPFEIRMGFERGPVLVRLYRQSLPRTRLQAGEWEGLVRDTRLALHAALSGRLSSHWALPRPLAALSPPLARPRFALAAPGPPSVRPGSPWLPLARPCPPAPPTHHAATKLLHDSDRPYFFSGRVGWKGAVGWGRLGETKTRVAVVRVCGSVRVAGGVGGTSVGTGRGNGAVVDEQT